jgi:hypothetical protein
MKADIDKREGLESQELLKEQLKAAQRLGDKEEIKRIEKLLAPDAKDENDQDNIPHPWA